jgi:hypothetical protein
MFWIQPPNTIGAVYFALGVLIAVTAIIGYKGTHGFWQRRIAVAGDEVWLDSGLWVRHRSVHNARFLSACTVGFGSTRVALSPEQIAKLRQSSFA